MRHDVLPRRQVRRHMVCYLLLMYASGWSIGDQTAADSSSNTTQVFGSDCLQLQAFDSCGHNDTPRSYNHTEQYGRRRGMLPQRLRVQAAVLFHPFPVRMMQVDPWLSLLCNRRFIGNQLVKNSWLLQDTTNFYMHARTISPTFACLIYST